MVCVIVSNKPWHKKFVDEIEHRAGSKIVYIEEKELVCFDYLKKISPRYIFFPHWSYIIPKSVYDNFECVIFHMTDLPFGRGGSPLQNLISRGIYETKLSALRCEKELDAGAIYMKMPLSLWGTAQEIYMRAGELSKEIMIEIMQKRITPLAQEGSPVIFSRREQGDGDLSRVETLSQVFDYIRMLDAETYPHAFIETDYFHFEFSRASLRERQVVADVTITMRDRFHE